MCGIRLPELNGKNRVYLSGTKHNPLEVTFSILKVHNGKGHKRNLLDFAEANNRYKLGGAVLRLTRALRNSSWIREMPRN